MNDGNNLRCLKIKNNEEIRNFIIYLRISADSWSFLSTDFGTLEWEIDLHAPFMLPYENSLRKTH